MIDYLTALNIVGIPKNIDKVSHGDIGQEDI